MAETDAQIPDQTSEQGLVEKFSGLEVGEDELYAALMETSGKECESWYYFIRLKGNEKNLEHLRGQLDSVEFFVIDDFSTFDMDLTNLVSAKTAKQMSKLELNSFMFHRKYDGALERIDLHFSSRDSDETKIMKANDILGGGRIEEFIEGEDIDPEDMISDDEEGEEGTSEESSPSPPPPPPKKVITKKGGVPKALLKSDLPHFARGKRKNRK